MAIRRLPLSSSAALRAVWVGLAIVVLAVVAAHFWPVRMATTPLPQRAYLWQREWTVDTSAAVTESARRLDGLVVLGTDVAWRDGQWRILRPTIDWGAFRSAGKSVGLALRIDPSVLPLEGDPARERVLVDTAKALLAEAAKQGVACDEFQVDFDCADRRLGAYRQWLGRFRTAVKPPRLVITALPAWLNEREFSRLVREVDGYVLQVHSVQTRGDKEAPSLFDAARAERWVMAAARLGRPFVVSLPTYAALVGFDPQGRRLGMALDGVQPSWPTGTRVVEVSADPVEIAPLIARWRAEHPAAMTGIIWYRVPVKSGARNWRWPTLTAVMAGRVPTSKLEVRLEGDAPVDLKLANSGEAEETMQVSVAIRWDDGSRLEAVEALRGWNVIQRAGEVRFERVAGVGIPRLLPGSQKDIGWLRFTKRPALHVEITR